VDGMRAVLLAALGVLEAGLNYVDGARERAAWRRFLKNHPDVIPFWTDGT
jgi:hypothetical protein